MLAAAKRSPTYALIKEWRPSPAAAPEFRTLPMVWYVPPLSPVSSQIDSSPESETIDRMRIPMAYLANLLTAGDEAPVRMALKRLSAVRGYMRTQRVEKRSDTELLDAVGLDEEIVAKKMYRLMALARLEDRFVLPTKPVQDDENYARQGRCGFGGPLIHGDVKRMTNRISPQSTPRTQRNENYGYYKRSPLRSRRTQRL